MNLEQKLEQGKNGARGMRLASSICMVLAWIFLIFFVLFGLVVGIGIGIEKNNSLLAVIGLLMGTIVGAIVGVLTFLPFYFVSCRFRALATMAEAAQLYLDKNKI